MAYILNILIGIALIIFGGIILTRKKFMMNTLVIRILGVAFMWGWMIERSFKYGLGMIVFVSACCLLLIVINIQLSRSDYFIANVSKQEVILLLENMK